MKRGGVNERILSLKFLVVMLRGVGTLSSEHDSADPKDFGCRNR